MPYTSKAVTKWADANLPEAERRQKVLELYNKDFQTEGYHPKPIFDLRREVTASGDLLARGIVLSPDQTECQVTTVWKTKKACMEYLNNPVYKEYLKLMVEHGWLVEENAI